MFSLKLNLLYRWLALAAVLCLLVAGAQGTTVMAPDFEQLVNESDYIIRGTVKSVNSEVRAKSSGQGTKIITKVEVEVLEVIAGKPPEKVVLEMLGGKVGDQELVLEGAPRFNVGDEDILFVSGNGHSIYPLFAMMHGRYRVQSEAKTGRRYVARSNKVPLRDTAEVALPLEEGAATATPRAAKDPAQALTPAQFVQRIKATVNPGYSHVQQH